jgi:2'-5' RNA ligase
MFIAVDVDDAVRRGVVAAADAVRAAFDRADRRLSRSVKWGHPRQVHLTLHFLGEVDEACARGLQAALREPLAIAPFGMELAGVGVFPPSGPARVVWLGAARGGAELAALHALVGARLAGLPVQREDRRFHPHLTLGRFREPARGDIRGMLAAQPIASAGACRVSSVTLYRSHLAPSGPSYEVIGCTPLAA